MQILTCFKEIDDRFKPLCACFRILQISVLVKYIYGMKLANLEKSILIYILVLDFLVFPYKFPYKRKITQTLRAHTCLLYPEKIETIHVFLISDMITKSYNV